MPGILASQPTITKERVLLGLSELRALTPLDRGKALKGVFEIVNLVLQVCEEVARMHWVFVCMSTRARLAGEASVRTCPSPVHDHVSTAIATAQRQPSSVTAVTAAEGRAGRR